jgi:hypothetical protein
MFIIKLFTLLLCIKDGMDDGMLLLEEGKVNGDEGECEKNGGVVIDCDTIDGVNDTLGVGG